MSNSRGTDALAAAIAQYLRGTSELAAAVQKASDAQLRSNAEVIGILEQVVAKLNTQNGAPASSLPVQFDAWDIEHIARYMKRTPDTVRRDIVVQPTFPKAMRIPGAGRARALYKAREVVAWLESKTK